MIHSVFSSSFLGINTVILLPAHELVNEYLCRNPASNHNPEIPLPKISIVVPTQDTSPTVGLDSAIYIRCLISQRGQPSGHLPYSVHGNSKARSRLSCGSSRSWRSSPYGIFTAPRICACGRHVHPASQKQPLSLIRYSSSCAPLIRSVFLTISHADRLRWTIREKELLPLRQCASCGGLFVSQRRNFLKQKTVFPEKTTLSYCSLLISAAVIILFRLLLYALFPAAILCLVLPGIPATVLAGIAAGIQALFFSESTESSMAVSAIVHNHYVVSHDRYLLFEL